MDTRTHARTLLLVSPVSVYLHTDDLRRLALTNKQTDVSHYYKHNVNTFQVGQNSIHIVSQLVNGPEGGRP